MTDRTPSWVSSHRQSVVAGLHDAPPALDEEADVGGDVDTEWQVHPDREDDADLRDRQDRLRADAEIVARLSSVGFMGRVWETLQEEIAGYGVQRLMELMKNGAIFDKCASRGYPRPRTYISRPDREDLAEETVGRALVPFRERLRAGGWTQSGGATLSEFFVGFTLPIWASAFMVWLRQQGRAQNLVWVDADEEERIRIRSRAPGPEELAVQRQTIREGLSALEKKSPLLPSVLALTADGYEQNEIAELLDTTPRSVEGALYRHRQAIKSEQERS